MRHSVVRALLWRQAIGLLLLTCAFTLFAQTPDSPCNVNPDLQQALETWTFPEDAGTPYLQRRARREQLLSTLLEKFPDDLALHQRRMDLLRGPMGEDFKAPITEYEKQAAAHPEHSVYATLYAKALVGYQTPKAVDMLEGVLKQHPGFAPAHLVLANIALWGKFKDLPKAAAHLETYRKACPDSLEGFALALSLNDQEHGERNATRLRGLLQDTLDPQRLRSFDTLWALEFRSRPASGHEALRKQVALDLKHLQSLNTDQTLSWLRTLRAGRHLLGDRDAIRGIDDRILELYPKSNAAAGIVSARFYEEHPFPTGATKEVVEAWAHTSIRMAGGLIAKWPKAPSSYHAKLMGLRMLSQPSAGEVSTTADRLLETYAAQPDAFRSVPPVFYQIAEAYLLAKVRTERIPEMVQAGTAELARARDLQAARDTDAAGPDSFTRDGNYSVWLYEGAPLLVESFSRRSMIGEAQAVIDEMDAYVREHAPAAEAAEEAKRQSKVLEAVVWEMRGRIAEAEQRFADAAALYLLSASLNSIPPRPKYRSDPAERASRIWKQIGGTPEGLQAIAQHGSTQDAPAFWKASKLKLPAFEITDTSGRIWRRADLVGKKTFINLWATWCSFCHPEMPYVQKLSQHFKDNPSVRILTLNLDQNPGLIQPYLQKNGYTFPVLPAVSLAEQVLPRISLPRNWILNENAEIQWEQEGYNSSVSPGEWLFKKAIGYLQ